MRHPLKLTGKVVIMMCGDIEWDTKDNMWLPAKRDAYGILFGPEMVEAAAILWRQEHQKGAPLILLVTGGKANHLDQATLQPSIAEVNARALIDLGVPEQNIYLENEAGNSLQQLQWCSRILRQRPGQADPRLLAMSWHMPRIEAIRRNAIHPNGTRVILEPLDNCPMIDVESILVGHDAQRWGPYFQKIWGTPEMAVRFLSEWSGTAQAWNGTYKWKPANF